MKLVVTTPLAIAVDDGDAAHLRAEDETGAFGVLPGHADFLTALSNSVVTWRDRAGGEHHAAAAAEEFEQAAIGDGCSGQHCRGKPRRGLSDEGKDDRAQANEGEQGTQSLPAADVEHRRPGLARMNEARPGYRALEDLGVQQVPQAPDLEVLCLQRGKDLDGKSASPQPPAEFDVLD